MVLLVALATSGVQCTTADMINDVMLLVAVNNSVDA